VNAYEYSGGGPPPLLAFAMQDGRPAARPILRPSDGARRLQIELGVLRACTSPCVDGQAGCEETKPDGRRAGLFCGARRRAASWVLSRAGQAMHTISSLVVVCLCLGGAGKLRVDNVRLLFLEAGRTWPWSLDDHPFETSPVHPRLEADANALSSAQRLHGICRRWRRTVCEELHTHEARTYTCALDRGRWWPENP
jgi:hypothetical protein